jgi:glycosyltransferase involved in cell wall biosynthesis
VAAKVVPTPVHPHVALFFSNFAGGGIQRVMLNLAGGLAQAGWKVDLVVVQAVGPLRRRVPPACRVFYLRARHASWSLLSLAGYMRAERPSALLSSQTHLNVAAVLARLLSRWQGRLLLGEHIALDQASSHPMNAADRLLPFLARVFYPRSDGIILVSRGAADGFIRTTHLPPAMVRVIYNPIVDAILDEQSRMPPGHAWYSDSSVRVILAAGRLVPQKDFQTLLKAFALLLPAMPKLKLIILGEGRERSRLEALATQLQIRDEVALPGFAGNPHAHMAHAALFVLSSRWEGFANVIVEALACGTPVVATDCPSGPAEILESGVYGELTPVGDVRALAEAMRRALVQPRAPALLRRRALDFSVGKIVPQYMEALQTAGDGAPVSRTLHTH